MKIYKTFIAPVRCDLPELEKHDIKNINSNYIYFLFNGKKLVYIGKSINYPVGRILAHIKSEKVFNKYSFIKMGEATEEKKLRSLEGILIMKYKPKYNIVFPKNNTWIKLKSAPKKIQKIKPNILNKHIDIFSNTIYVNIKTLKSWLK